jgi:hypothetical protein
MNHSLLRLAAIGSAVAMATLAGSLYGFQPAEGGTKHSDPAQVVPLQLIAAEHRESVSEVLTSYSFHHQGAPDAFPCHPQVYLSLLNQPVLTLALWNDLSATPARLRQVGPDRFEGTDGNGTTASWQFVYRSPRLHVMLCNLDYVGPRGSPRINGRIVMVVHTEYFRKEGPENWVRHHVEAFVKVDSRGWRAVAKTVRPILEKVLEDQVQEAGWFVSLMGRLVEIYPYWACQVAQTGRDITPEVRKNFATLVVKVRRPGALTGRPVLAENSATETKAR